MVSDLGYCRLTDLWELACRTDPVAWAMRYVKVPHPQRGMVPFIPWDYQARLARDNSRAILVNKGRQLGISTGLCSMRVAFNVSHRDRWTELIVSRKGETAAELMWMVKQAISSAAEVEPDFPHISKDNEMRLEFRGRTVGKDRQRYFSRVVCETASPNAGKTYTAHEAILDEYGAMDYARRIRNAVWPTLSRGGSLLIVSTPPEDPGTEFERMWRAKESPFMRYELPWTMCPEYDEAWAERTRREMGEADFQREYACDFSTAGKPYFPASTIEKCYEVYQPTPSSVSGEPEPGHRYLIAADIAGGGEDSTVIGVWDVSHEPWTLVWSHEFELIGARELQSFLDDRAVHWGADLIVDASGLGEMLLGQLRVPATGLRIVGGYSWREADGIINVAKEKLLAHMLLAMDQGRMALPSMPRLDQELRQYSLRDAHLACDWVMMTAIAAWRADEALRGGAAESEVVSMADLFPAFRPVRAMNERMWTQSLRERGL